MQVHIQPFLSIHYGYHQENLQHSLLDHQPVKTGDQQRSSFHVKQTLHIFMLIRHYHLSRQENEALMVTESSVFELQHTTCWKNFSFFLINNRKKSVLKKTVT